MFAGITPDSVVAYLERLAPVRAYPDLGRVLRRGAAGGPRAWGLPAAIVHALGGEAASAWAACAALACLQLSIVLVDDLLDEDMRGEHLRLGPGRTANLALAFQALAGDMLADQLADTPRVARALSTLQRAAWQTALGQSLDSEPVESEDAYWRVVEAKSAGFFGAAFRLGAECAGAAPALAEGLERAGRLYGQIIQIHDDLADCLESMAGPDWRLGRGTLPLLYARLVDHPDRERFVSLCTTLDQPGALSAAQDILWRSGAVGYGLYAIGQRHDQALQALHNLPLTDPAPVRDLFNALMVPVEALLAAG
jgi:geranylgeranyl pyrophosphate synthase